MSNPELRRAYAEVRERCDRVFLAAIPRIFDGVEEVTEGVYPNLENRWVEVPDPLLWRAKARTSAGLAATWEAIKRCARGVRSACSAAWRSICDAPVWWVCRCALNRILEWALLALMLVVGLVFAIIEAPLVVFSVGFVLWLLFLLVMEAVSAIGGLL